MPTCSEQEAERDFNAFEREYEEDHSWEELQEDEYGNLRPLVSDKYRAHSWMPKPAPGLFGVTPTILAKAGLPIMPLLTTVPVLHQPLPLISTSKLVAAVPACAAARAPLTQFPRPPARFADFSPPALAFSLCTLHSI